MWLYPDPVTWANYYLLSNFEDLHYYETLIITQGQVFNQPIHSISTCWRFEYDSIPIQKPWAMAVAATLVSELCCLCGLAGHVDGKYSFWTAMGQQLIPPGHVYVWHGKYRPSTKEKHITDLQIVPIMPTAIVTRAGVPSEDSECNYRPSSTCFS